MICSIVIEDERDFISHKLKNVKTKKKEIKLFSKKIVYHLVKVFQSMEYF